MRQPNGCSTPGSAAKQWIEEEITQKKKNRTEDFGKTWKM